MSTHLKADATSKEDTMVYSGMESAAGNPYQQRLMVGRLHQGLKGQGGNAGALVGGLVGEVETLPRESADVLGLIEILDNAFPGFLRKVEDGLEIQSSTVEKPVDALETSVEAALEILRKAIGEGAMDADVRNVESSEQAHGSAMDSMSTQTPISTIQPAGDTTISTLKDMQSRHYEMVDVDDLLEHPRTPQLHIRPWLREALTASMKAKGFDPAFPIKAWFVDGKLYIVDGRTRRLSAVDAKIAQVPVALESFASENEFVEAALEAQNHRRQTGIGDAMVMVEAYWPILAARALERKQHKSSTSRDMELVSINSGDGGDIP